MALEKAVTEEWKRRSLTWQRIIDCGQSIETLSAEGGGSMVMIPQVLNALQTQFDEMSPLIGSGKVWSADVFRFMWLAADFTKRKRQDGMIYLSSIFWGLFNPEGKRVCGRLLPICQEEGCGAKMDKDSTLCPVCASLRRLCDEPISSPGGRCREHDKSADKRLETAIKGTGRHSAYKRAVFPSMGELFSQVEKDANYLSLEPEIDILGMRNVTILRDMADVDIVAVKSEVKRTVDRVRKAIDEGRQVRAGTLLDRIDVAMEGVGDNERRWREFKENARLLASLADTERRRIVDAQTMMTEDEMIAEQQMVVYSILAGANRVADDVEEIILGILSDVLPSSETKKVKDALSVSSVSSKVKRAYREYISQAIENGDKVATIRGEFS